MRRRPRSQRASLRGWCSRARHLAFALRGCRGIFAAYVRHRCANINRGHERWAVVTAWLVDNAAWHAQFAARCHPWDAPFHDRLSDFYLAAFDALVYGYAERRDEAARLARGPS